MSDSGAVEVTEILRAWRRGESGAEDRLLQRIYGELRHIAVHHLRGERGGHTLQPTALVHETYLRMLEQRGVDWRDRAQFFGLAATMMRRILVDHARARSRKKRQPDEAAPVTLAVRAGPGVGVLDLDRALVDLASVHPRHARVVEMRYFGELDNDEIAECLGVSLATVKRDWQFARAWLRARLDGQIGTA
jgi:RNA polymerase sigma factor (TIGR02999 family)